MPVYDYRCRQCDIIVTVAHDAYDDSPVVCETCGDNMFKKFGVGAVVFKGTGWGHQSVN